MSRATDALLVSVLLLTSACGDDEAPEAQRGGSTPAADLDCAGGATVAVADAVAADRHSPPEEVRLVLGSLGMHALAERVPDQLPTAGADGFVLLGDGFVALADGPVVYLEDGRTVGAFVSGSGSVCSSVQQQYAETL